MLLGTLLIIAGLWWVRDVTRRPDRRWRDYGGPLLLIIAGALLLGGVLWSLW